MRNPPRGEEWLVAAACYPLLFAALLVGGLLVFLFVMLGWNEGYCLGRRRRC